jgi:LPXTG-motif cell wall-anchored protein
MEGQCRYDSRRAGVPGASASGDGLLPQTGAWLWAPIAAGLLVLGLVARRRRHRHQTGI